MTNAAWTAVVLLAFVLALPTVAAFGGGTVANVAPTGTLDSQVARVNQTTQLVGTAVDGNGEQDIAVLRLVANPAAAPLANATHNVTAGDLANDDEPGTATAGWRVWDAVQGDGILAFTYEWTPPLAGTYHWTLVVDDEALAGTIALDVTTSTGGGGGGSGPRPPPIDPDPTDPNEPDPDDPGDPDPDGDPVVPDPGEPGPIPDPAFAEHAFDLTWSLDVQVVGGVVHLAWAEAPEAIGYQVWRSMSPYVLVAELPADHPFYAEPEPAGAAHYKVTYFTGRSLDEGWVTDPAQLRDLDGWQQGYAETVGARPSQGPLSEANWPAAVVALAAVVTTVVVALRLQRR